MDHVIPSLVNESVTHDEVVKIFQAGGANSDLLTGGALNEDQQLEVMHFIRSYAVMTAPSTDLNKFPANSPIGRGFVSRAQSSGSVGGTPALVPGGCTLMQHKMGRISGTYDQLHMGQPLTRGATEGTRDGDQYNRNPARFGRRDYQCYKLRSSMGHTTEFFERNIRQGQLNSELANAIAPRLAQDFEDLAINGDSSISGTTPRDMLRKNYDGWLKQSRASCFSLSAGGDPIEFAIFMEAIKSMPEEYSIADHKWWAHPWVFHDLLDKLHNRKDGGAASDAALAGIGLAPFGFPMVLVPSLPRSESIYLKGLATAGHHTGTEIGPFVFETTAFQINLNIDAAGVVTIVFPTKADSRAQNRLVTSMRAAAIINAQYSATRGASYAHIARVGQHGTLEIISPTTGGSSTVVIAAPANSALAVLGLTAGTYTGETSDTTTGRLMDEGTAMWLSPAWNFVQHIVTDGAGGYGANGLRMYTKFEQSEDQVLTDIYSWQGASLMAPEATIVINNLRVLRPGGPVAVL